VVLEMGMYDLGEIAQLCRIARPQVGVVTNVGPVHLERLGTIERVAQAKTELVQALPADGVAVLNADDPLVTAMAGQTEAQVFWYGLSPKAHLWADEIEGEGLDGIRFRFHYQHEVLHVRVPLLGRHSVHTALRAAAVGLVEGLSWEEIVRGMQQLDVQLRLIAARGLNGATLLDDTYNASPASTLAALNLLADLPVANGRRIAVLGDMLELGSYEEEGHRKVGVRAADVVDFLITVGLRARLIAAEAAAAGLAPAKVLALDTAEAALAELRSILGPGDVVLVKGSRAARMDEIAAALTDTSFPDAEPEV
jgi:UDP-N-acetylmuramoyl-tripeptide--D-alanyl-D-alanine ligase